MRAPKRKKSLSCRSIVPLVWSLQWNIVRWVTCVEYRIIGRVNNNMARRTRCVWSMLNTRHPVLGNITTPWSSRQGDDLISFGQVNAFYGKRNRLRRSRSKGSVGCQNRILQLELRAFGAYIECCKLNRSLLFSMQVSWVSFVKNICSVVFPPGWVKVPVCLIFVRWIRF